MGCSIYWHKASNIVFGLARDQGYSSKNTVAIQAAVLEKKYDIPFTGNYSWLYAGEAASAAFITSVSKDMKEAKVFNLNGDCKKIEDGISILRKLDLKHKYNLFTRETCSFSSDLDDNPLKEYIGNYASISFEKGVDILIKHSKLLNEQGKCPELPK